MNQVLQSPEFLQRMSEVVQRKKEDQFSEEVKKAKFIPRVPEGVFYSLVTDATVEHNVRSKYGLTTKIVVTFLVFVRKSDETQEEIELRQTYWQNSSPTSLYCILLSKLLGRDVRDGFRLNELMGVAGLITIKHNETENGAFANVTDIELIKPESNPSEIML